jgi:hypothetical protein
MMQNSWPFMKKNKVKLAKQHIKSPLMDLVGFYWLI